MKKLTLLLALAVCAFVLHAQDGAAPTTPPQGGPKGGMKDGKQPPQQRMIEKLQKSAAEVTALYDGNQDGVLDDAEKAALARDIEIAKKLQPHMRNLQMLQKVDANNNMTIEPEEAKKIREVMKEMRPKNAPNGKQGDKGPMGPPEGAPEGQPPCLEGGKCPAGEPPCPKDGQCPKGPCPEGGPCQDGEVPPPPPEE